MKQVTINTEQALFVIPQGKGYSCLGFDVCQRRIDRMAGELRQLGIPFDSNLTLQAKGSLEAYNAYRELYQIAETHHKQTGYRFRCELTPELIPYEGKRVEVRHRFNAVGAVEVSRFIVGKSTGWIPIHLEIKTRRSTGGGGACLGQILSVREV